MNAGYRNTATGKSWITDRKSPSICPPSYWKAADKLPALIPVREAVLKFLPSAPRFAAIPPNALFPYGKRPYLPV